MARRHGTEHGFATDLATYQQGEGTGEQYKMKRGNVFHGIVPYFGLSLMTWVVVVGRRDTHRAFLATVDPMMSSQPSNPPVCSVVISTTMAFGKSEGRLPTLDRDDHQQCPCANSQTPLYFEMDNTICSKSDAPGPSTMLGEFHVEDSCIFFVGHGHDRWCDRVAFETAERRCRTRFADAQP